MRVLLLRRRRVLLLLRLWLLGAAMQAPVSLRALPLCHSLLSPAVWQQGLLSSVLGIFSGPRKCAQSAFARSHHGDSTASQPSSLGSAKRSSSSSTTTSASLIATLAVAPSEPCDDSVTK